jgi:hypothetical protein
MPDAIYFHGREDQTERYHLPTYSTELSPVEYLNCDPKAGVHSGMPVRSKGQLKKKTTSYIRMLQKKTRRVKHISNTKKSAMPHNRAI